MIIFSFFKTVFIVGATFKIGSVIFRKIAYKIFLRPSIHKNGLKVKKIDANLYIFRNICLKEILKGFHI